jgi:hypothetical protein
LTEHQIADKLLADDNADWTHEQARAMAAYLIEYAENFNEPLQFDRVAIRCDFSAYPSVWAALSEYQDTAGLDESSALQELCDHTTVIQCDDDTIIIQNT